MTSSAGPIITTSNLSFIMDAANYKSYPYHASTMDHCISDYYCFSAATATYSMIDPGISLFQVNVTGNISTVVSANITSPQRGTVSVAAGNRYYSNGACFLLCEGSAQYALAPMTMAGNVFMHYANRNNPTLVQFYAPYKSATINYWDGNVTTGGISNVTVTANLTLAAGQSGNIVANTLNNWMYFASTSPVVATATQYLSNIAGYGDRTVMSPAAQYVYNAYSGYLATIYGNAVTLNTGYVVGHTQYPVMNITIGDGAGGDCNHALGYEFLSDTYSFGNYLRDYEIVAPYPNTYISTSYWNGSSWVVWDAHNLSGTQTAPVNVNRSGDSGAGVTAASISGTSNAMVGTSTTLWKWQGNNPFHLRINDSIQCELSMTGWMAARPSRTVSITDTNLYDISGNRNTGNLINYPTYSNTAGGAFLFNGSDTYISFANTTSTVFGSNDFAIEMWFNLTSYVTNHCFLDTRNSQPSVAGFYIRTNTSTSTIDFVAGSTVFNLTTMAAGNWYHVVYSRIGGTATVYVNGSNSGVGGADSTVYTQNGLLIGRFIDAVLPPNALISMVKIYNGSGLTQGQVIANFTAHRGRYGV